MATPETKTGHLVELLMDVRDTTRAAFERDGVLDREERQAMSCIDEALAAGEEVDHWRQDLHYVVQHGFPPSVPLSDWRMRRRQTRVSRPVSDLPPAA